MELQSGEYQVKEIFDYLYSLRNQGSSFGIERMELLLGKLGSDLLSFPVIHVAGTNGKGSTCAMLDSIYQANGYSVGLFSSPHLVDLGERVRINGKILSDEKLFRHIEQLRPIAEEIEHENPGMHPSFFEMITAVAFCEFADEKVDVAVLETGLGGRLDSTNVVAPEISVITTISLDHCHILGNTIEKIAREKAGIIKEGVPVVTGWLAESANHLVQEIALEKKAPFFTLAKESAKENLPITNLKGEHQQRNAALAVKVTQILQQKFPVKETNVKQGLNQVKLDGRWQIIQDEPLIILDACHNEEGAQVLGKQLEKLPNEKELVVWFGSLGEDRAKEILSEIVKFADEIRFFKPDQPRACCFDTLCTLISPNFKGKVKNGERSETKSYLKEIKSGQILLITGSIYLLGEIIEIVKNRKKILGSSFQDIL